MKNTHGNKKRDFHKCVNLLLIVLFLSFISCTDWDLTEEHPIASVLSVGTVSDSSVTLQWTQSDDRSFAGYHVYKGEGSVVDTTDELIDTLIFIVDTIYTVKGLQADSPYSFRIMTAGKSGANSVSNTVEVRTLVSLEKSALKLTTPDSTDITDHSVNLRWDREWNWDDSVYYRVYMDTTSTVDSLDSLVSTPFYDHQATITNLQREKDYYFRVYLEHKDSAKAGSNTIKVVTKSGASTLLNQRAILSKNMFVVSHIAGVIPKGKISSEWLFYWLKTIDFNYFAHATTLPSLPLSKARKINIPVAPINEQKRIVAEIEKQFSRLDEAVENLKRVKANLKRYKASVLKAAVEGKLTEQWRAEHPEVESASKLLERILTERRKKWEETELAKMKAKGKKPKDDNWKKRYRPPTLPPFKDLPTLPEGWTIAGIEQLV